MTKIRAATTEDAPRLFEIHDRAVAGGGADHYPQEILDVWNEGRSIEGLAGAISKGDFYVLFDSETIFGFMHLDEPEIVGLFIDPDVQRKGHGAELFRFAVSSMSSRPLKLDSTLNAVAFYTRMGCWRGAVKNVRRRGRDIYVVEMELR